MVLAFRIIGASLYEIETGQAGVLHSAMTSTAPRDPRDTPFLRGVAYAWLVSLIVLAGVGPFLFGHATMVGLIAFTIALVSFVVLVYNKIVRGAFLPGLPRKTSR
jgi:hypothetical protein